MTDLTIERIERAIAITAEAMARHNLPQLLPTLKRLEPARRWLILTVLHAPCPPVLIYPLPHLIKSKVNKTSADSGDAKRTRQG